MATWRHHHGEKARNINQHLCVARRRQWRKKKRDGGEASAKKYKRGVAKAAKNGWVTVVCIEIMA